jgi:hypothetical protein
LIPISVTPLSSTHCNKQIYSKIILTTFQSILSSWLCLPVHLSQIFPKKMNSNFVSIVVEILIMDLNIIWINRFFVSIHVWKSEYQLKSNLAKSSEFIINTWLEIEPLRHIFKKFATKNAKKNQNGEPPLRFCPKIEVPPSNFGLCTSIFVSKSNYRTASRTSRPRG